MGQRPRMSTSFLNIRITDDAVKSWRSSVALPRTDEDNGHMRRYYPEKTVASGAYQTRSIEKNTVEQWHKLWTSDRSEWFGTLRDRPKRFDPDLWQRAVSIWRNEIPRETGAVVLPLDGVPFLVKDLFDVPGERTTCSSAVLLAKNGAQASTAVKAGWLVQRFLDQGAHLVGRTTMNEFAYGLDGRNVLTGDCPHPLDRRRISGGSSSGSAWAVASGVVPFALGTDTGGSIRLPAAICGIYGIRLGWDPKRLSGVFPLARSLDTVGWFTHNPEDMQGLIDLVFSDEKSIPGTNAPAASKDNSPSDTDRNKIQKIRLCALIPPGTQLNKDISRMWDEMPARLRDMEMEVDHKEAPDFLGDSAVTAYDVIGSSEAWSVHQEWISEYGELYDPVVRGLIERGRYWTTELRTEAERTRQDIRLFVDDLFRSYDFLIMPATVIAGPRREEADGHFRKQILRLNTLASLAGLPALSVPVHFDAVQSGGFQIVGPMGGERRFISFLQRWSETIRTV